MQELQTSTSSLQSAKRKAEQTLASLQEEYEEMESESHENNEKLRKMMEQNGRIQSEMVADREKLSHLEKEKVCWKIFLKLYLLAATNPYRVLWINKSRTSPHV